MALQDYRVERPNAGNMRTVALVVAIVAAVLILMFTFGNRTASVQQAPSSSPTGTSASRTGAGGVPATTPPPATTPATSK